MSGLLPWHLQDPYTQAEGIPMCFMPRSSAGGLIFLLFAEGGCEIFRRRNFAKVSQNFYVVFCETQQLKFWQRHIILGEYRHFYFHKIFIGVHFEFRRYIFYI
jgi:hypothetical protein